MSTRRPTCPATGKRIFRTKEAADKLIGHLLRVGSPGGPLPVRAYVCSECGKWHVTSKGRLEG